ncbi:MAG TPA: hypothetical protein PLI11_00050 [Clostridia bacterium]|nr:hypothetical protein [Clostridiaceae bacterium]HOA30815.1 hypothetical protein [Clostridia bacterium]HPZ51291.1 hypothetical protein [Clostridia bacterium]
MKYAGLAKEIEELLVALSEHYSKPCGGESQEKKVYDKPDMLEVNKVQYNKFKTIISFIQIISDNDNDIIQYQFGKDGLDVNVEWKTPSLYLSSYDRTIELFSRVLLLADSVKVCITGLDEMSVCFKICNVMRKVEKSEE